MKILMLVPFLPNREMSGGQTRWYNLVKYLSKKHEITLMSLIKDDWEKKYIPELESHCKKVMVFKRPKSPWTLRNFFLTAVSFNPLVVIRNFSFEERLAIKKELSENKYDLIHAETFYVMPHIPRTKIPIVLVEPTIEFSVYSHYVKNEVPNILKPIYNFDVIKLRFWEKYYWRRASLLFAVSEDDKAVIKKVMPERSVGVIPNGVDFSYFEEKKIEKKKPDRILYVGNYKWMQNVEALNILVKDIWPKVKERYPHVRLWITGVNMPPQIMEYKNNDPKVIVTEGLPDIRDAYKASAVLVAPIKGPGGTRLKVLEAMASGLPVVSTPVGVAGLGLTAGVHALVSANNSEIVSMTLKVLKDKAFADRIALSGKKFVRDNFDWKSIVARLEKEYEKT